MELLQLLGPMGGLEQVTEGDTDDLDATSQSFHGKHTGHFGGSTIWHPFRKDSGEPSPGPCFEIKRQRAPPETAHAPDRDSSRDTGLVILWTMPVPSPGSACPGMESGGMRHSNKAPTDQSLSLEVRAHLLEPGQHSWAAPDTGCKFLIGQVMAGSHVPGLQLP